MTKSVLDTTPFDFDMQADMLSSMLQEIFAGQASLNHDDIIRSRKIDVQQYVHLDKRRNGLSHASIRNCSFTRRRRHLLNGLPDHSLLVVLKGRVFVAHHDTTQIIGAGNMVVLDNHEPRTVRYENSRTTTYTMVSLGEAACGPDLLAQAERQQLNFAPGRFGPLLFQTVAGLTKLNSKQQADCTPFFYQIDNLCRIMMQDGKEVDVASGAEPLFAAIKQLVERGATDSGLTQVKAASLLGMSAKTVHRILQRHDTTFGQLLSQERVRTACDMLGATDLSNEEISHRVGYGSGMRFYRQFREQMHMTPGEYRENLQVGTLNKAPVPSLE